MKNINERNFLPTLALVCLGLIWGSNFLYMKLATQYISPIQVVFLRVAITTLPIIAFGFVKGSFRKEHFKYWYHFLIMSLLAAVVYYYCFVVGSHLLYSGIAGALSGSSPLFSFVLAAIFLNEEKISFTKIFGLILGFFGVVILAKPFDAGITDTTWKGIVYMAIGSLSLGASFIYAKKYISPLKINGIALVSYQLVGATTILAILTPFNGITNILSNLEATLGLVIGLSLLGTGLAFLIYYYIVDKLGALKAASVTYIPPIVALIIGAFIGGEPIVFTDILGTLIILFAVYLLKK